MNNLTVITCSYNTPIVTANMLKSLIHIHPNVKILVCDNSTTDETQVILDRSKVPYIKNTGGLHAPSVDLLLRSVTTRYALLVDTDIIFLKSHEDIFEQFKGMNLTLMGDIEGDRGGKRIHLRVHPWHCFIDVQNINAAGIQFYDKVRLCNKEAVLYDVGSSFFEDIRNAKLRIADLKGNDTYYKHYEGMSWRVNRFDSNNLNGDIDNDENATHCDLNLYRYGKHIEDVYKQETQYLTSRELKYTFNE